MNDYLKTFEARGHFYNDAMATCPEARALELKALLERGNLKQGQTILDAPAGGGYVANGVEVLLSKSVELICVEPSFKFSEAISSSYRVLNSPIQQVPLESESVDRILSLAGLHHVPNRQAIYSEWYRLLKHGGYLAVGDVGEGTCTGIFLNSFVDQYSPEGHKGVFIAPDEFNQALNQVGFHVRSQDLVDVPWIFPDLEAMGRFCSTLFGTQRAGLNETIEALQDTVGVKNISSGGVALQWQLCYASAYKN